MFNDKKSRDLILFLTWIVVWILLIFVTISQQRYLHALCVFYAFLAVTLKRGSILFGFHLHTSVKWGYLLIGIPLLFLQIGYKDFVPYTQVANVLFVLVGCWGMWSIR